MTSELAIKGPRARKRSRKGSRQPRSFWIEQCNAYKRSNLSPKQFIDSQGLASSTFYQWMNRLEREGVIQKGSFVRVEIDKSAVFSRKQEKVEVTNPFDTLVEADESQAHQSKTSILDNACQSAIPLASKDVSVLPCERQAIDSLSQLEANLDLKLTFNQGLVLNIPKGFDLTTLRQVVEVLAPC